MEKKFLINFLISSIIIPLALTFIFTIHTFSQEKTETDDSYNSGEKPFYDESSVPEQYFYSPDDTAKVDFVPNTDTKVIAVRIDNADITIDGELNEKEWQSLKKYGNFCEVNPGDRVKPAVQTDVLIFYDDKNIYIGFIIYENDIKTLRKTLCKRDNIWANDYVGMMLDTYGESKNAYEIFVNPYGIQGDGMWTSPGNEDMNFDLIWYSDAKINSDKWTVEISIPFKSIKFPNKNVQDWHFHFWRNRPRDNRYQYSFVPFDRNIATLFSKYGELTGIQNIKGGKNLEIIPYLAGTQSGQISDYSNANSDFVNEKIKGNFGFNIKYGLTSTLTSEFAYNPDFSQVEADPGVINVNSPYAIFYPEKRPFFNEGSSIFSNLFTTVYTRTVNNPLLALKLTGKVDKNEIGFISAYDKKTPFIIPFSESSDYLLTDRRSLSNILRYKRSVFTEDSYIGLTITDREVNKEGTKFWNPEGYNRVFSLDGSYRFLESYNFRLQIFKSFTKEIDDPNYESELVFGDKNHTGKFDGESYNGTGMYFNFSRSAEHYNFDVTYANASPEARLDNGFMSTNDYHQFLTWQGYVMYIDKDFLKRIQPSVQGGIKLDYNGRLKEQWAMAGIWFMLKNQIQTNINFLFWNNEDFGGVYNQNARRVSLNVNANTFNWLTGGFYVSAGKYIIRFNSIGVGNGVQSEVWVNIKPIDRIVTSFDHNYFELSNPEGTEKLFAGYILRNTTNIQIFKDISLRFIAEYNSFSSSFYINPLVTYQPNPFTIFYAGFTNQYEDIQNPQQNNYRYTLSDRQFFLKMQYLFQF